MTLQDILNVDVAAVGDWAREGLRWWLRELDAIVPARWRRRGPGDRPLAQLAGPDQPVRLWRKGRSTDLVEREVSRFASADLALPEGSVLTRTIMLPPLSDADLRRLVSLDIDRLTPFGPDQIYFDIEALERDPATGRQPVRLGLIVRAQAEAALERARRHGLAPRRMGMLIEGRLTFDFLEAMRAAGRGGRPDRRAALWWSIAVGLIVLNVGVMIFKDIDDVSALRAAVDLQRPTVALAQRLRSRVELETRTRAALLARRSHNEPLGVVSAVTRAFPAPQWVQRLEWNGRTLRLVGFHTAGFDVLAAVRSAPQLGSPRELTANGAAEPGAMQPFNLVAEPNGARRR